MAKISIARISTNRTVNFVDTGIDTSTAENEGTAIEILALKCDAVTDNKTTYVQLKVWVPELDNYRYPPYADCDYVE